MRARSSEERARDDLRRRLYAPGATPGDLERFEAARTADPTVETTPPRRSTGRRWAVGAGVLVVGILVAAIVARQPEAPGPRPSAPAAATPSDAAPAGDAALLASQTVRAAFVRALRSSSAAGLLPYLEAHPDLRPDALRTLQRAASTEYSGEGATTVDLDPSALAERGGRMTVIVVTDAAATYRWRATDPAGRTVATHEGAVSAGGPVSWTVAYRRAAPGSLRLLVPDRVRWGLAVTFSN